MIGFEALFDELKSVYGPQHWWPADDAFEIMVGSLLVQRTSWKNAALAVDRLRERNLLEPTTLASAEPEILEDLVRCAGFFRTKASRLRRLAAFVAGSGGVSALATWRTARLRDSLLELHGVGPETADTILLYAFNRPAVVVDEYLRRLVCRLDPSANGDDEALRQAIGEAIPDARNLNEFHALVIEHGKRHCSSRPRCAPCPLRPQCRHVLNEAAA